jgi:predicted deacetylase
MPVVEKKLVCISVHDVAPETWPGCRALLEMLDALGPVPVTLLVVPDYHRGGRIDRFPEFLRAIEHRLARGDEVALHGYCHLDESAAPRAPRAWFERRVLTRAEGEFAAISRDGAEERLQAGLAVMTSLGWPVHGFVAPAWLAGSGARSALGGFPFAYTTTRTGIYRLPSWEFTFSPSLVYSVGAAWRHAMSESLNGLALAATRNLLRVSLHPVDARYPRALEHWRRVIRAVLEQRTPLTKAQWARGRERTGTVAQAGP